MEDKRLGEFLKRHSMAPTHEAITPWSWERGNSDGDLLNGANNGQEYRRDFPTFAGYEVSKKAGSEMLYSVNFLLTQDRRAGNDELKDGQTKDLPSYRHARTHLKNCLADYKVSEMPHGRRAVAGVTPSVVLQCTTESGCTTKRAICI